MEIKDVQPNQGNIDLVLTIKEKGDARTFEKFGKTGKVCSAKAADESGEIKLTLWNDDVDKVNVGNKIHLKNGWCSEYQGERHLSSGKFGEIEVLEAGGSEGTSEESAGELTSEEPVEENKQEESPVEKPVEESPSEEESPVEEPAEEEPKEEQPESLDETPVKEEETII